MIEVKHIQAGYGKKIVVKDVSFTLKPGEVFCLLGPNGVGKTTLFKTILGFLPRISGDILLEGSVMIHSDRKQLAQYIGYVPQVHEPPFPFKVMDVVVMGGLARSGLFSGPSKKDQKQAEAILDSLEISYLKDAVYTEISGGERQMVLIARALMQNPKYLMMDEPTSNLDYGNQMRVLKQIRRLSKQGIGVIMTTHFPDHAFLCCTKAAILSRTKPFCAGPVDEIVTETNLYDAYKTPVKIADIPAPETVFKKVTACVPILE